MPLHLEREFSQMRMCMHKRLDKKKEEYSRDKNSKVWADGFHYLFNFFLLSMF